jgi:hypothetical protein
MLPTRTQDGITFVRSAGTSVVIQWLGSEAP